MKRRFKGEDMARIETMVTPSVLPAEKFFFWLIAFVFVALGTSFAQDAARAPGWVVIPVQEYRELRARAFPVEHDPEPPPLDATLTRVDYELQINGDVAEGTANLTVDVLKDGWVRVPIPAGLLVRHATLEGKLVSLVPSASGKGIGQVSALLSHAGRSILVLQVDVPVAPGAGDESVSLPSTDSGVTRALIQLSRQGVDLGISGGLLSEKSDAINGTKWIAYGRGNEPLVFTWRKKNEEHHVELPLRLRGSLTQLISLSEDSTSVYAEVNLDVVQGAARMAKIELPDKVTINQVSGAMVADWEMKDGTLLITFLEPVEKNARFVVNGETRLPREGAMNIPVLRLLETERDTGGVAVEVLGAGEIKDVKAEGLEDADATDLGEMIASRQSPSLAAFRFRTGDASTARSLNVNIARYAQQAVLMANIEEARYDVLVSNDGKMLVQARYAVRNNSRNFVKITLPAGAIVWSAALGGKPIRPGQSPDGSLLLPLEKAHGGDDAPPFEVEILYLSKAEAWHDKGNAKLALPALDLPVSRTGLLVYYPPLFKVAAEPGPFRMQEYENPTSAAFNPPQSNATMAVDAGSVNYAAAAKELADNDSKDKRDATQALLDQFRTKSSAGKVTGILPVNVSFPAFGPSIFLVSELTAENQSPSAELNFQRDKKAGAR